MSDDPTASGAPTGDPDDDREQPELAAGTEVPEELTEQPEVSPPTGAPDPDQEHLEF